MTWNISFKISFKKIKLHFPVIHCLMVISRASPHSLISAGIPGLWHLPKCNADFLYVVHHSWESHDSVLYQQTKMKHFNFKNLFLPETWKQNIWTCLNYTFLEIPFCRKFWNFKFLFHFEIKTGFEMSEFAIRWKFQISVSSRSHQSHNTYVSEYCQYLTSIQPKTSR